MASQCEPPDVRSTWRKRGTCDIIHNKLLARNIRARTEFIHLQTFNASKSITRRDIILTPLPYPILMTFSPNNATALGGWQPRQSQHRETDVLSYPGAKLFEVPPPPLPGAHGLWDAWSSRICKEHYRPSPNLTSHTCLLSCLLLCVVHFIVAPCISIINSIACDILLITVLLSPSSYLCGHCSPCSCFAILKPAHLSVV